MGCLRFQVLMLRTRHGRGTFNKQGMISARANSVFRLFGSGISLGMCWSLSLDRLRWLGG
jgi:hypothetical protein